MHHDDSREDELKPAPEVGEKSAGGDLAGSVEDEAPEDRPEHARPTGRAQDGTEFIGAPETG